MEPGRSRRTAAPEPVETTLGGIDALPWTGAAGPGYQAATVADGRRKPKTDAPRWRKCSSWMQGGLKDGERKPATMRVAGWRPGEGREAMQSFFYFQTDSCRIIVQLAARTHLFQDGNIGCEILCKRSHYRLIVRLREGICKAICQKIERIALF